MFLILILLFSNAFSFINNKEFRIINENKVVVYTTRDYYLLFNCKIINNEIKIYKGTQTKIDNINVESKLSVFKSVAIISNMYFLMQVVKK